METKVSSFVIDSFEDDLTSLKLNSFAIINNEILNILSSKRKIKKDIINKLNDIIIKFNDIINNANSVEDINNAERYVYNTLKTIYKRNNKMY
jgi:hypothetical protein